MVGLLVGSATYLALPVLAGAASVGDLRGPKIYPQSLHTSLYVIGWELAGREGKPRVAIKSPPRPWMYGR
jgi:hypothetical protein